MHFHFLGLNILSICVSQIETWVKPSNEILILALAYKP